MTPALAAAGDRNWGQVALWVGVLLAALVLLWFVARRARRLLYDNEANREVFTLQDLREMRDQGLISDVEFQRMRSAILGLHQAAMKKESPQPGPGSGPESGTLL